jgi:hypothetical protein
MISPCKACARGGKALSSQVGARIVMRIIGAGLYLAVLLAASAFARGGGPAGGGGHAAGGGHAGGGFHTGSAGSGFRGGALSRGYNGGFSRGAFGRFGRGNRFGFGLGFYNPWLWNYGYPDYGYPYDYSSYAPAYPDQYPDQNYLPPVVVNQGFQPDHVAPLVREYPGPPPQPPGNSNEFAPNAAADREPLYLLATNDGVIRAVLAYWAEKDTVQYVTMDHERKSLPISAIDRQLSSRLNRERGVSFGLPK